MKKILVFGLFFSSSILSCAAASTSLSSRGDMVQMAPFIALMMHPKDYISDVTYFDGNDQEREELVSFALKANDASKHVFYFLSHFLQKIRRQNPTLENLCDELCKYPLVDADRITFTKHVAHKHFAAYSIHDAVHRLSVDMQNAIMDALFKSFGKSSLRMGVDISNSLDDILVRLICLEKKAIKMSGAVDNQFLVKALHQSVLRGIKLEIITMEKTVFQSIDTRHNIMIGTNSLAHRRYILFECNLDNKPVVVHMKCEKASAQDILQEYLFIDRDRAICILYDNNFQSMRESSATTICIDYERKEQKNDLEDCLKTSPESQLLHKALESIWDKHFCSPIKVESFEESCKRQRRC